LSKTIKIGVSFSETKYPNYPAWILDNDRGIEIISLSWENNNLDDLHLCQGLLLTGGLDLDPWLYEPLLLNYPNQPKAWNRSRDEFELELFGLAQSLKMPILGICRGLQLVNIALGGSLIMDLEAAGQRNHRNMDGIDYVHPVLLKADTLLKSVCFISDGVVNSAHHQAIDKVAELLSVNCFSDDGIIEGIEWKVKNDRSPMLCVQWHPERIQNKESNPLSQNIKEWFFEEAIKFKR